MYVLIAEFDPQRAATYRRAVEAQHLEPVLVRDGESAREVLRTRGVPVLLICDFSLPRTDGFTLIADVRRLAPPDRTAILVFTAFPDLCAAAGNLRQGFAISDIREKNGPFEHVQLAIAKALASVSSRPAAEQSPVRSDPEQLFRSIMIRASKSFRAPIVLLSVEMREQRRVRAHVEMDQLRGSRHQWPIIQQVANARQPMIVPDLTKQALFGVSADIPELCVRGFVTVPLMTSAKRLVGVMSLLDFKPLTFTPAQLDLLLDASRKVADEIERRLGPDLAEPSLIDGMTPTENLAELTRLALTDPLTGLSNRHAGERALDRDVARARRARLPFSLALLDLDNFKEVNDRFGHAAGDEILRRVSQVLASTFRASDLAVRWGGDEFLVLLPDIPAMSGVIFAERARMQIETLKFAGGKVTISAGVVEIQQDESPSDAIARADAQLYEAKRAGRNRVKGST